MADERSPVTTHDLLRMKEKGERIVSLTCYDALFARLLDASGVDIVLVGDSVNQVLAGAPTTLSATLDQMIYHTTIVRRGVERALVVCDMPFLTYQVTPEEAIRNCGRAMRESGCHAVKLEGGQPMAATVRRLVDVGIPVMGHIGLTPQSVHKMGGYVVQGWASIITVVAFLGGIQLMSLGIMGEYLARMHQRTLERPAYTVAQRAGGGDA